MCPNRFISLFLDQALHLLRRLEQSSSRFADRIMQDEASALYMNAKVSGILEDVPGSVQPNPRVARCLTWYCCCCGSRCIDFVGGI
jgi:hypothetical protein